MKLLAAALVLGFGCDHRIGADARGLSGLPRVERVEPCEDDAEVARHVRVRNRDACRLCELSGMSKQSAGLKTYGMILADNGSNWYIGGAPSPKWSNMELHALGRLTGADFEVVDTSKLRP